MLEVMVFMGEITALQDGLNKEQAGLHKVFQLKS